ncbi:MAG: immunoglobulin domain-containing protein [Verrucomicrobiota bacterium]
MKGLFQRLTKASGPMQAGKPEARLTLAAFGKHPGWDDHMPGIGLETDALVLAKQVFYVHGIGGQVDSGAWEKIEPSKRLDGYDHTFLWLLPGHAILGRLWSSTDGKGRSKYPMVVCLDAEGFRPARIIETLRPELEQLRVFCQSTNDSNRVVAQCHSLQDRLRSYLLTPLPSASGLEPPLEVRRRFLEQPELGPDRVGLLRVLHELEKAVQVFSRAPDTRLGMVADLYHVRLPQASSSAEEGLLLWAAFLRCIFNQSVPLLLLVREKHTWIDVIIGEPKSDDFFCLQASAQAAPLATEIPYELAPELRLRLQELEAKFLGLESKPTPITPLTGGQGTAPSVSAKPSEPPGRSKVWMALVPLLLLLVAGVLLFPKSGSPTGATGPSPTSSRPSPPAPVSATPLTVVAQPQDQTLLEGGDVLLASQIVGPASIRYQWVHEGTNLPGQTNVTLRLGGVRTNDAGRYWLMIASEDGSTNTRAAHVNITEILSPPTIVAHPTNQTVMEGAEALFTVSAHGRAPLWFQWVHDGTNLPGQTNLSLRLTAVSPYHSGRYWMVVSNAAGSTNSQPATLAIQPAVRPVSLVSQPQSQTVTEGADVLLSIQAGGTGPLHFQWLHEGTNLPGPAPRCSCPPSR